MKLWQTNRLKRINLLEGSVSSGKTWISLVLWAFWVRTMPDKPDNLYLMTAKSLTTLKNNCLYLLQSLVGESNFKFNTGGKEGWLFGRHILFEGANDISSESKIRGLTLTGAYCDEATKLPRDFFVMLLSRLRRPGAKLFATTNPDSPTHWLKTDYIDRKDELSFLDITFRLDDNAQNLPAEYVENLKLEYTGIFYDRFILGLWTLAEGLIYPMYEKALAEPPSKPAERYILSIDYGTQNPLACLIWAKIEGIWYAVDGYYYSGRDTGKQKTDKEYADKLDSIVAPYFEGTKLRTIVDPSAASFIEELRRHKLYQVIQADNDVLNGIRETASAIEQGKIKISPKLKEWRDEAASYIWNENEMPTKENDHYMDATRYFVKTEKIIRGKKPYHYIWNG